MPTQLYNLEPKLPAPRNKRFYKLSLCLNRSPFIFILFSLTYTGTILQNTTNRRRRARRGHGSKAAKTTVRPRQAPREPGRCIFLPLTRSVMARQHVLYVVDVVCVSARRVKLCAADDEQPRTADVCNMYVRLAPDGFDWDERDVFHRKY